MANLLSFARRHRATLIILVVTLILAGFLHGYNMFHYPYYEEDEGTYFGQAYAVAYQGQLTNYTYWYDHTPIGWIIVAGWMLLTGGPFSFGYSLHSARIFMLLVHLASSIMIFLIVRKATIRNWPAVLATIIFSLSPLAVYFQRRLLLDNIMTFWMLLAVVLLIHAKERLLWVIGAGMSYAIAVLSKETAIVTVPGFWLLILILLQKRQRITGVIVFSAPVILGILYFLLFAFLKNELFPGPNHVSLDRKSVV
jgi:4-amino-4-deoxy-L-arabinose transferase-like glycosyltransferase